MIVKKPWSKKQKLLTEFNEWRSSMRSGDLLTRETLFALCQGAASRSQPCLWCEDCRKVGFLTCIACGQKLVTQKKWK